MNLTETLIRLRDDLKYWATKNFQALNSKIESRTIDSVQEDGSDTFNITDPTGNVIAKVDADGITTVGVNATEISTDTLTSSQITDDSGTLTVADGQGNPIARIDALGVHTTDITIQGVSIAEKMTIWDNKSGFDGDYNNLYNTPAIVDNESADLHISDDNGNVIAKFDSSGLTTTDVIVNGTSIAGSINNWNNKSNFSGDYQDLRNLPNITDDNSAEFNITDNSGKVIAKINNNGITTTKITTNSLVLGGTTIYALPVFSNEDEGKVLTISGGKMIWKKP